MLVAYIDRETGSLATLEFQETRADLGEVEKVRTFLWERRPAAGSVLLIPESGHLGHNLDDYWLMWRAGQFLFGQTVHHPVALSTVVDGGERLIDRPIVSASQDLYAFAWRGNKLIRRRYSAKVGQQTSVSVDIVWETDNPPVRTSCVAVPGGEEGAAMIGMVHEVGESLSATVLRVKGKGAVELTGTTEGRYRSMGRHRMALHAGIKSRPALATIAISRDDESYVQLEAQFDLAKGECVWKRTRIEFLEPEYLQSAAVFFYKSQNSPEPFVLAVDRSGHLIWIRKRIVQVLRENVGPDYGYPILTTMNNRYEAVGAGENIAMVKF